MNGHGNDEMAGGSRYGAACGLVCAALLVASGCYAPPDGELPARAVECVGCHGQGDEPAPPTGLWLNGAPSATSERGVGAHRIHLRLDGTLSKPVACTACHVVPNHVDDEGHIDSPLPAELTFAGRALLGGAKPSWDGTRCSNAYCHGATLAGGTASEPLWTLVDGSQTRCDSCHGAPPPLPHPQASSCWGCHGDVVGTDGRISDPSKHINGVVDVDTNPSCNACHGSADNAAPPRDTAGRTARSERGVGAHQAHVRGSARHPAYACSECHIEPKELGSVGHLDSDLPAEVTFGAIAGGTLTTPPAGLAPTWNAASELRCANTWCHGRDGAGTPSPQWTSTQRLVCGSCHGLPPSKTHTGAAHPAAALSDCANCHKSVIDRAGNIIAPDKHVNGVVDL